MLSTIGRAPNRRASDASAQAGGDEPVLGGPDADLGARGEAQLVEDVLDVRAGGPLCDDQLGRDLAIAEPARHQRHDLPLAPTQWSRAYRAPGGLCARHLRL